MPEIRHPVVVRRLVLLVALPTLAALAACASGPPPANDGGPEVEIVLGQVALRSDILFFRGPVPLDFVLTVRNRSDVPVTLRRVELRTQGRGAYSLRAEAPNLRRTIAPGAEESIQLSTWGRSRGGFLSPNEPVTLLGIARFESPSGPFTRFVNTYVPQPSG
jgi:hypothetical protein